MKTSNGSVVDRLLSRYGLASPEIRGSDAAAAAHGGLLTIIEISRLPGSSPLMRIQIGDSEVTVHCPITEDLAAEAIRRLQSDRVVHDDASFTSMFASLLIKLSKLYVETGAQTLSIQRLHLHPTSYHIDGISIEPPKALHVRPRRSPNAGRAPVRVFPSGRTHRRESAKEKPQ